MTMNLFGRAIVTAEVQPLYTAQDFCEVTFWVVSDDVDGQKPSTVYVNATKDQTTFHAGTPLEKSTKYSMEMAPGNTLWAITEDIAQMGFMVKS